MPYTDTSEAEEETDGCTVEEDNDSYRDKENLRKMMEYLDRMAYRPREPKLASKRTEELAKPKKRTLAHTYKEFGHVIEPPERKARIRRLHEESKYIPLEQFKKIYKKNCAKERAQQKKQLRREEIYFELLEKLESRSRAQYLNVMVKKFADFIAKLATTMRIPPQLVDPYARMHRGIFCNILNAIGMKPMFDPCVYRPPGDITTYEVSNKLAHALLSLIIKALDEATALDPNEVCMEPVREESWDKNIRNCLKCAALKKCRNEERNKKKKGANKFAELMKKCHNFDECYEYL